MLECDARGVELIDLNQDGYLDIVVLWSQENNNEYWVEWFENDGKGNYGDPEVLVQTPHNPRRLLVTDLDLDGDLDILTSHQNVSGTMFHENLGALEFKEPVSILESGFLNLLSADIDQDGDMDMIMGSGVYLNDGNLNFTEGFEHISLSNTHGNSVFIVDWDGDGDLDIFGHPVNNTSWIRWYENLDNQDFAENERLVNFFQSNGYVWSLDIKDADNDGDLDIYAGMFSNSSYYFENLGNNVDFITTELNSFTASPGYLVDLDVDGDLDPIKTNSDRGIVWHEHYGASDFSSRQIIQEGASLTQVGDMDSDGDLDLVYIADSQVQLIRNLHDAVCVSGKVFVDSNANNIFDVNEEVIDPLILNFEPSPVSTTISEDGSFKYYFDKGDYQITIDSSDCWIQTTGSNSFDFSIDTTELFDFNLAVEYNSELADLTSYLTSGPTRCGFTVPFRLNTINTGCKALDAKTYLVMDELATLITSEPLPDETSGDTLFWNTGLLPVDGNRFVEIEFEIAGVDNLGDTIQMDHGVKAFENSQELFTRSSSFQSVINCSYDPNDKLTFPARGGRNYTLMDEELLYTIRFQNTGTDTAFNIEIRDELSPLLDYSSFRIVESSHSVVPEINFYTNKLHFHFDNILLPDSIVNLEASQGQVSFVINPIQNLEEKVEIFNEAEIYFDFNPPIITNEVVNTFVSEFSCVDSIGPNGEDILPLDLSGIVQNVLCFGDDNGVVTLTALEGIGPYYFESNSFLNEFDIQDLEVGDYTFIVTDDGNCVDSLVAMIAEPEALIIEPSVMDVDCFGESTGSILTNVAGGVPEYTFLWDDSISTENLINVPSGSYQFNVIDFNNCEVQMEFTIEQADSISVMLEVVPVTGNNSDGSISVMPSGGNPPFSFDWLHDDSILSNTAENLSAGDYTVNITDSNACNRTIEIVVPSSTKTSDPYSKLQWNIHPNPSSGDVFIKFDSTSNQAWHLEIYNTLGQLVSKFDTSENQLEVNLEDGIYLFTISINGVNKGTKRVIIDD